MYMDWRILLKLILRAELEVWTTIFWLRIGTGGGLL
jgi:hypothetical protein